MEFRATLGLALRALGRNKMRTALTMLGVIIGVAAVICTVSIGEGASQQIQAAIINMGSNMVWIEAGGVNLAGVRTGNDDTSTLTLEDLQAIRENIKLVDHVSPNVDGRVQVVYGNQNWATGFRGISPEYLFIRKLAVQRGTFFGQEEIDRAANVCVLGPTVVSQLFGNDDPIGQTIRVSGLPCLVIGELVAKGESATGQDQDDTILMPYTTAMKKIAGRNWLDDIWSSAISTEEIPSAEKAVTELLHERHHIAEGAQDDFNIRHPVDLANAAVDSAQNMELLLASVASIALVVGGIGIMNIMLVSVTERTREIGVRMAVGATGQAVQMQFLIEAVVMSLMGGAAGLLCGIIGSVAVARFLDWPTTVPLAAVVLAVLFSAAIGIFFGYYPARKAATLDPIEALRYE